MNDHIFFIIASLFCGLTIGCNNNYSTTGGPIFPKGDKGPSEKYIGNAWHHGIVYNDTTFNLISGSTRYQAGARSNWHSHPTGQILIIIEGEGYYQEKGKPKQVVTKGQVIKCPPNVPHWDGGTEENGMAHIYIVTDPSKGIVDWMEPVTDEEYHN